MKISTVQLNIKIIFGDLVFLTFPDNSAHNFNIRSPFINGSQKPDKFISFDRISEGIIFFKETLSFLLAVTLKISAEDPNIGGNKC